MKAENIFYNIPDMLPEEFVEKIFKTHSLRIERIISKGHISPKDFWYDQEENEWIILLRGSASILFEDEANRVNLFAGDYLNIPAHVKHRVERTEPDAETIWLAIFY